MLRLPALGFLFQFGAHALILRRRLDPRHSLDRRLHVGLTALAAPLLPEQLATGQLLRRRIVAEDAAVTADVLPGRAGQSELLRKV